MTDQLWSKGRAFLLVTGASRGLGRAFAQELSACLEPESTVFLTARSKDALQETANTLRSDLNVKIFPMDHEKAELDLCQSMMGQLDDPSRYTSVVVVHNAGTIGGKDQGLTAVRHFQHKSDIDSYLALNYTSVAMLNSVVLQTLASAPRTTVINVSSLCGVEPWPTYGLYCSVKAARNMLFKVLATEEASSGVKVLNYAPGPIDTQLVRDVMADPNLHSSIKDGYQKLFDDKTILQPNTSAEKLVKILNNDAFKSGDHVDFYDVE